MITNKKINKININKKKNNINIFYKKKMLNNRKGMILQSEVIFLIKFKCKR